MEESSNACRCGHMGSFSIREQTAAFSFFLWFTVSQTYRRTRAKRSSLGRIYLKLDPRFRDLQGFEILKLLMNCYTSVVLLLKVLRAGVYVYF